MKITDIRSFVVGNKWKNWIFVKVYTDESVIGLGEATTGLSTKPTVAAIDEIKHIILGMNALNAVGVREEIRRKTNYDTNISVLRAIYSINIALWDILGKSLSQPLYQLFGGKCRHGIRAYANGWYQGPRDPKFFADKALETIEKGFTALKIDPFGNAKGFLPFHEMKLSIACVEAIRNAVGDDVDILIEAHDRFNVPTAIQVSRELEPYHPFWIETPVYSEDIDATCEVARKSAVAVATGERFTSMRQFAKVCADCSVQIVQPELLNVGIDGIRGASAIAEAHGASIAPHCSMSPLANAINVNLDVNLPNSIIQESFDDFHLPWVNDVIVSNMTFIDGMLIPSDHPGHGVVFNEKEASKHPYDEKNLLQLFEKDWEKRRS